MSLTLIPVRVVVTRPNGAVVVGAAVSALLTPSDSDGGLIVPSKVEGTTGNDGSCVLSLWPNSRGVNASRYKLLVIEAGVPLFDKHITVPEAPSNVWPVAAESLINQAPYPEVPSAQIAVADAQEASLSAQASAVLAGTAADSSSSAASSATASATSASASAGVANGKAAEAAAALVQMQSLFNRLYLGI